MKINLFDINFLNYNYENPWMFLLFIPVFILVFIYLLKNKIKSKPKTYFKGGAKYSTKSNYNNLLWLKNVLFAIKILALLLLVLALATPYSKSDYKNYFKKNYEGIDIVLAIDVSASMLAMDFEPNRLESAKNVATDFIDGRVNDRIALVMYEGEAFTKCPLTYDYKTLKKMMPELQPGVMKEGTAIGTGLATAINRLRYSKSKSKVIIILSDGANNSGELAPINVAEIAKEFGIKVYTIGVGKKGQVPYPDGMGNIVYVQSDLDENTLQKIADITGGEYFHAENSSALKSIYNKIDQLEKTTIKTTEHISTPPSQQYSFMFIALIFVCFSFGIEWMFLKQITP